MTSTIAAVFSNDNTSTSTSIIHFLPEIVLDPNYDYSCALLDLIISKCTNLNEISKNIININCDIISESYINGSRCHTIHQFVISKPNVKDQTIIETPKHLNYFPIKVKNLRYIQISFTNQNGSPLNFISEKIICRLNIKREASC